MYILLITSLLFVSLSSIAQDDPTPLFLDQVNAYNAMDVEAMTNNLHKEFKWYYINADDVTSEVESPEAFRRSLMMSSARADSSASLRTSRPNNNTR